MCIRDRPEIAVVVEDREAMQLRIEDGDRVVHLEHARHPAELARPLTLAALPQERLAVAGKPADGVGTAVGHHHPAIAQAEGTGNRPYQGGRVGHATADLERGLAPSRPSFRPT